MTHTLTRRPIIFKAKDVTNEFLTLSGANIEYSHTSEPYTIIKDAASRALQGSIVKCEFILPEDPLDVLISLFQLNQIIATVVKNAGESMPEGGVVKIKAEQFAYKEEENRLPLKDGLYFSLCISDTGCGISQENLPRIFDPYFSTKQWGSRKGMGIELSVVYSLLSRLKGHIHVESKEGVGTEVFIYLPVAKKSAAVDKDKEQETVAKIEAAPGTKRVLVMDDEEILRTTVKLLLGQSGYYVDEAENGEEALRKYALAKDSGTPFDAVLLDLSIVGGMGGVETMKKLLEIDPQVKGIVFSGYSMDPAISNYEHYGFKGALTKPAKRAQIIEALKKVC